MLRLLPIEIALHIVSYLPLQSIYQVSLVSTEWHSLITDNEQAVYHNAAILHRFAHDAADLEAGSSSQIYNRNHRDWTQFCRRRLGIERGWRGKGPSTAKELTATANSVHRIKVDQKKGFVITTCHNEGLYVTDISTNRVLWADSHVVDYVHCEYDRGYIIFNRHDDSKEVWRLACDFQDSDIPEDFKPDDSMVIASEEAACRYASSTGRGHFRPWALLLMPDFTRAFRFSYPTLLSAGPNSAYLWDVPTSRLIETINNIQVMNQDGPLGRLTYVDVNDKYVFICGSVQLRIFAREGGALVYHLTKKMLPRTHWDVLHDSNNVECPSSLFRPQQLHEAFHASESSASCFKAAHVSSGNDLVALMASGIFVWIPDFERLIHHGASLSEIAVVLNFNLSFNSIQDISIYLALGESNEKAAVATRNGLYVISLNPEINKLTAEAPPLPGVSVCRVMYEQSRYLSYITCLQMTDTGIFFNWHPSSEQSRFSRPIHQFVALPPPQPQPQPPPQPPAPAHVLALLNHTAAPAQGIQGHGEGQSDHLPALDPVESSDEDDAEEDTTSDLPSPAHPNQVGPPALVHAPEEDEDQAAFYMEDDAADDLEIEDVDEPEIFNEFGDQFNDDDGFVNEWFLPVVPSMVHCIHV